MVAKRDLPKIKLWSCQLRNLQGCPTVFKTESEPLTGFLRPSSIRTPPSSSPFLPPLLHLVPLSRDFFLPTALAMGCSLLLNTPLLLPSSSPINICLENHSFSRYFLRYQAWRLALRNIAVKQTLLTQHKGHLPPQSTHTQLVTHWAALNTRSTWNNQHILC